ncbi:hypothetical protein [Streptomonospora salina]|uniref:Uncharacterized protein n=1 Tax=Streptomonospora salina TaxID=104205 RepID=A0A841EC53_9ACTN|nr:hypothetical protein [Streptomonospora salina]MBB6000725.1 hypothetical protein [Streptomonospora salina]
MLFSSTARQAAASSWPLLVLLLVLVPVAAVHGIGGALTHGHPDTALEGSAAAAHADGGGAAHGVHSLTVAPRHDARGGSAAGASPTGHADHVHADGDDCSAARIADSEPHSHADCVSVAPSAGVLWLVCWPAFLAAGPRALAPAPPRAIVVRGRRRRRTRLRCTRLRLAELSVLRI